MTSFTNQVPSEVLKSVVISWFKILCSRLKHNARKRNARDFDEESGYGSDGQENSLIARAEYRIACVDGDFEGTPRKLPTKAITESLEQKMEYLLLNTKGNGYFEFSYCVGFSDRPWCLLGGYWQSMLRTRGLCKVLAREWSKGKLDFKSVERKWKNRSSLYDEILFAVKIRLFVRETSILSMNMHPILLGRLESLTRNRKLGSKNNPRPAITKKSEFAGGQPPSKSSTESSSSNDINILAAKMGKALWVELWESHFPAEASDVPLTPPSATPSSEDYSSNPFSTPPLSPEVKAFYYKCLKGDEPMHHVRQILQTDLPAKLDKNGSPQSSFIKLFDSSILELTPLDSPVREDSSSTSPPPPKLQPEPFHVRSLKDLYSNDGQPLLASYRQFSSALKHFGHSVYEPMTEEGNRPYATDFLKPAKESRALADMELTDKPEGNSKLFGTWTNLTQDAQTSSAFVDKFQYGFYADENYGLKMVDNSIEYFSDGCQT